MSDEIKIERVAPWGSLSITEAELIGLAMSGQWFPVPVRYMTRAELEKEYPSAPQPDTDG